MWNWLFFSYFSYLVKTKKKKKKERLSLTIFQMVEWLWNIFSVDWISFIFFLLFTNNCIDFCYSSDIKISHHLAYSSFFLPFSFALFFWFSSFLLPSLFLNFSFLSPSPSHPLYSPPSLSLPCLLSSFPKTLYRALITWIMQQAFKCCK